MVIVELWFTQKEFKKGGMSYEAGFGFLVGYNSLSIPCVWAGDSAQISVTVAISQKISVNLNKSNYAFGLASEGATLATPLEDFVVTNDGNVPESIKISVGNSTNWNAGSANGAETFVMKYYDGSSWSLVDPSSGATLGASISPLGLVAFGLQIVLPSSTSSGRATDNSGNGYRSSQLITKALADRCGLRRR